MDIIMILEREMKKYLNNLYLMRILIKPKNKAKKF